MKKQNEQFGESVRKLLGERGLSLRQAKYKTGIDHTTIMDMSHGFVPRYELIVRWAEGMDEDPVKWLVLAGYEAVPKGLLEKQEEQTEDPIERITIALNGAKNLSDLSKQLIIDMVKKEIEKNKEEKDK